MNIINREKELVEFDMSKVFNAVNAAHIAVTGEENNQLAQDTAIHVYHKARYVSPDMLSICDIERLVFDKLCERGYNEVARAYEGYRAVRAEMRKKNTTDDTILSLVSGLNEELNKENSNKDLRLTGTIRDYLAGVASTDITKRLILPGYITRLHEDGGIHIHDMDYWINQTHNCCLVNLEDMFTNGTVINERMIETPTSFQTACTVMTQIAAQIASGQYGGQTMRMSTLAPYLRKSYDKYMSVLLRPCKKEAHNLMMKELRDGIQTLRYQLNTLQTSNG